MHTPQVLARIRDNGNVLCGECANYRDNACAAAELALFRAGLPDVPLPWPSRTDASACAHFHPAPALHSRIAELRGVP